MLFAAIRALWQMLSVRMLWILIKAVGLTVGLLALLWTGIHQLPFDMLNLPWAWAETALGLLADLGILIGLVLLALPVLGFVIGFFLDEVAGVVERRSYPDLGKPRDAPVSEQVVTGLRLGFAVLFWNLLVSPIYLFAPGLNLLVYIMLNGALIGREYFEHIALRRMPAKDMRALRRARSGRLFAAGALIALLLLIPGVNLVVPLFGTAFMVHLVERFRRGAQGRGSLGARGAG